MTMRAAVIAALGYALLLTIAAPAAAQSEHLLAAGGGVSGTQLNGGSWTRSIDYFIFRLPRPDHFGIAWNIGSDSFPVPVDATSSRITGSLRVRHFLFGPGYTWRAHALELTASALTGPTTNTFHLDENATGAATLSSKMSWSGMADLTAWIDIAPRWGIKLSGDYLFARPTLVADAGGAETRWKARRVHVQAGLVFGIY